MRQTGQKWIDTLKLSEPERQQLLDRLDATSDEAAFGNLRSDDRVPFETPNGVVTKVYQPGGSVMTYLIHPRNLSRTGMSFLHGSYVHEKSRCEVVLRTIHNETAVIAGVVMWCRHVCGRAHEVGVHFNQPIVMSSFVKELPHAREDTLRQVLAPLNQRVLYVEDSIDDQELLAFHFKNIGVEILRAGDAAAALQLCATIPFEVAIVSATLAGTTGVDLVGKLRAAGYTRPMVVLSADGERATAEAALARGATLVLSKPYVFDDLIARLREHLPVPTPASTETLVSEHWSNVAMRPLIMSFLGRLEGQVRQLGALLAESAGRAGLEKMCLDMRGSAGGYGYPSISEAAGRLYEDVRASAAADALKARVADLLRLCESACKARHDVACV